MKTAAYKKNEKSSFRLNYNLVWCSKYRRKILVGEVAERLRELLKEKAEELGLQINSLEVMPDHVQFRINGDATRPLQWIVNQLKGHSGRKLREEFPRLRSRVPTCWTRSYFVETIGISSALSKYEYIERQKNV